MRAQVVMPMFKATLSADSPAPSEAFIAGNIPPDIKVMNIVLSSINIDVNFSSLKFLVSSRGFNAPYIDEVILADGATILGSVMGFKDSCSVSFSLHLPANTSKVLSIYLMHVAGDGLIEPQVKEVAGYNIQARYVSADIVTGSVFRFVDINKMYLSLYSYPTVKENIVPILPGQEFYVFGHFETAQDNFLGNAIQSLRASVGLWGGVRNLESFSFTTPIAIDVMTGDYTLRNQGHFSENLTNDEYAISWFSNSPKDGINGYRFGGFNAVNNMNPGEEAFIPFSLQAVLYTPQFKEPVTHYCMLNVTVKSIDGIRGDIDGNGIVNLADVKYLQDSYNEHGGLSENYTFSFDKVNVGRGLLLFKATTPSLLEVWLLGLWVNNHLDPLVKDLNIGKSMAQYPISTVTVPSTGTTSGKILTIKTTGFAVNVTGLFNGKPWSKVAQVTNGQVVVELPSADMRYKIEAVSLPNSITNVETDNNLPVEYSVSQNYPNPFNPTTSVSYALPKPGLVKIQIYDILGRLVDVLLEKEMPAGKHQIKFDASHLSSGTYICRISAGEFNKSVKMILMK